MSISPPDSQKKKNQVPVVISDINDLKDFNIMPLIYPGGASGEFFASALSQTMPRVTLSRSSFYDNIPNRVNFYDIFNKHLGGGHLDIDNETILDEVNMFYYVNSGTIKDFNIALVHPQPPGSISWLLENLRNSYTLEIITKNLRSRRFRTLATNMKVNFPDRPFIDGSRYVLSEFSGPHHLRLEWEELLLTDVEGQFRKVEEFLDDTGDFKLYKELVTEYVARNQSLIDQSA